MLACFICHDKLKQCHVLQKQCLEAEERFAQMFKEDFETKPQINRGQLEFSEYAVTPTQHISVFDVCHTESTVIKEESPDDCEGQDGKQHTDSEHECKDIAFEYISPHCSASGGTTPRPYESNEEGDSEDDLPLMEFKIEIEEEKVSQEKRQPEEMKKLELENVSYCYADVKDIPAHHSESDSFDDDPVTEIKTKVEDRVCVKDKRFKCDICQSSFIKQAYLTAHIRSHTGEKPYKCHICQRGFTQKSSLVCHIRIHTVEKPYKCDFCQSSFRRNGSLTMHIRTHTGEKPYKCDICQSSFHRNGSLKRHILTHTGGKPFKCDICQHSFSQKSHLTSHIRVHTGEKPFKCDICRRSFTQKSSLICHIRKHTCKKSLK